jgi:hypothetical protein
MRSMRHTNRVGRRQLNAASLISAPSLLSQHPTGHTVHKIANVLLCSHHQARAHKRFLHIHGPSTRQHAAAAGHCSMVIYNSDGCTTMHIIHSASARHCKAPASCSTPTPLYRCCATEYIAVHGMAQHKLLDPTRNIQCMHNHAAWLQGCALARRHMRRSHLHSLLLDHSTK